MKPKHKFNLIIALVSVSILITLTGIAASVHHCIKWADYCKNENLSATVVEFSQNMIFHAYYWMGVAFACISLMATMALWYFSRQQNLHPKQTCPTISTQGSKFKKLQVNVYTNEITMEGLSQKSRNQVVTLLDYLVKHPKHKISFSELNTVFNENFFDGFQSSKRKISNLKYETNNVLKNMGFELVRLSSDQLALVTKERN